MLYVINDVDVLSLFLALFFFIQGTKKDRGLVLPMLHATSPRTRRRLGRVPRPNENETAQLNYLQDTIIDGDIDFTVPSAAVEYVNKRCVGNMTWEPPPYTYTYSYRILTGYRLVPVGTCT